MFSDPNTRGHFAWTIGNGVPMHGVCINDTSRTIPTRMKQEEKADTIIIARE